MTAPRAGTAGTAGTAGSSQEIEADTLAKALELARQVEELLEDTRSIAVIGPPHGDRGDRGDRLPQEPEDPRTHSTRMARAMAASLVDELDALVRPSRRTGSS